MRCISFSNLVTCDLTGPPTFSRDTTPAKHFVFPARYAACDLVHSLSRCETIINSAQEPNLRGVRARNDSSGEFITEIQLIACDEK